MLFSFMKSFVTFASLAIPSTAYTLDQSCKGSPNEKVIDEGVNYAISMAQDAYDLLTRRPWNAPGSPDGIYSDLATWIFKEDGSKAHQKRQMTIPETPDPRDSLSIAQDLFGAVVTLRQKKDVASFTQPVIYCDTARYTTSNTHKDKFFQKVAKVFKKKKNERDNDLCKGDENTRPAMAWAWSPKTLSPDSPLRVEIQICPDYLKKVLPANFRTSAGIYQVVKTVATGWKKSTMDSYALLDCTILHEFFHTYQGGMRDDIDEAYGWETCVEMSHDKSLKNAENFMFFALGVRMIKNQKLTPLKDGNVIKG